MKIFNLILFAFFSIFCFSQSNTEVFLFDIGTTNSKISLKEPTNISNNEGYDNQPSFLSNDAVIFASSRNGQTDIARYDLKYGSKSWLNFTEGGEYSPLKIPNKNEVSAVRLDKDGKQRLYLYNLRNGESKELIQEQVVAYYTWYDENTIVSANIEVKSLNLYVNSLNNGTTKKFTNNVGRSFHKIPNSNLVSFISKENDTWLIKSINPANGKIKTVANTIDKVEDICWLNQNTILSGKDGILYKLTLRKDNSWKEVADLRKHGITKITRLAINSNANKLLIAADINDAAKEGEETSSNNKTTSSNTSFDAGAIVHKHIEPYNQGDLTEFASAFTENVVVNRFPNEKMYQGRSTLKQNYERFFANNKNLSVQVNNRMVLKNMVIDEEIASVNKAINRHVTVYQTSNKGIETMTFISNSNVKTNPEIIVGKQLEAYNNRDLDAFMKTYTSNIKLYAYPNTIQTEGQSAMRKSYESWFKQTKDLNAVIKKRIVIGNKVIDYEEVTANGQTFSAIAIYEIVNGLINKVTFIQ